MADFTDIGKRPDKPEINPSEVVFDIPDFKAQPSVMPIDNKLGPFMPWVQHALPAVYDDSLSYFETLTRLSRTLDVCLQNDTRLHQTDMSLGANLIELRDFVNRSIHFIGHWFNELQDTFNQDFANVENYIDALDEHIDKVDTHISEVDEHIDEMDEKLDKEIEDRKEADTQLQSNIDKEAETRENADNQLQSNIDSEANAREEADNQLQSNIDNEAKIRADADIELQTNIDNEASARIEGDNSLKSDLETEAQTRATADTELKDAINTETANRTNADNELSNAITNEANTRSAEDTNLWNAINTEISDRTNADSTLQTNIDNEATTREANDKALDTKIDNAIVDINTEHEKLEAEIIAESEARQLADNELKKTIIELTDSVNAHVEDLNSKIEEESDARTSADNILQANLEDEAQIRANADEKLANEIETCQETCKENMANLTEIIEEEIDERKQADTELNQKIENEIDDRNGMGDDLAKRIENEAVTREEADSSISNELETLSDNFYVNKVVPQDNTLFCEYKVTEFNDIKFWNTWVCHLKIGRYASYFGTGNTGNDLEYDVTLSPFDEDDYAELSDFDSFYDNVLAVIYSSKAENLEKYSSNHVAISYKYLKYAIEELNTNYPGYNWTYLGGIYQGNFYPASNEFKQTINEGIANKLLLTTTESFPFTLWSEWTGGIEVTSGNSTSNTFAVGTINGAVSFYGDKTYLPSGKLASSHILATEEVHDYFGSQPINPEFNGGLYIINDVVFVSMSTNNDNSIRNGLEGALAAYNSYFPHERIYNIGMIGIIHNENLYTAYNGNFYIF